MVAEASDECHAFAGFCLYPKRRTLLHGSEHVSIRGRAFDILHLLVPQAGTVVSVSDLMSFVWANIRVEEANLRVQMGILRKALSRYEDARRAIETIPLRGYCFILPVRHHPDGIEHPQPHGQADLPTPARLGTTGLLPRTRVLVLRARRRLPYIAVTCANPPALPPA